MADILHEEFFSSLKFTVQSCPRVGGGSCPIDPIDYVTGIGNAHSNQYKIFAHSALWCWSSSPRSELENSVSWTAEVRLS